MAREFARLWPRLDTGCKSAGRIPEGRDAPGSLLLEVLSVFDCRQYIIFAGYPYIERRQQEDADHQVGDQATDNHNGEGALRVGADGV